jgi:RNA polymerase sigma-70 factor, ECF subfamily
MTPRQETTASPQEDSEADAELMKRLGEGDCAPLGVLYRRYGRMVLSMVHRCIPSLASLEADDVCQDVFLALNETAPRYRDEGRLKSWICGIAIRKAKEVRRNRWLRAALLDRFRRATPRPSSRLAAEAGIEIEQALGALSEGQRDVLLLHTVENLSAEEIAAALGIRVKTVFTRLHRAREAMRRRLEVEAGSTLP